ncbi:hypothetical protein BKA81DRAFT_203362 [Phyllosticta paracitricarpa]
MPCENRVVRRWGINPSWFITSCVVGEVINYASHMSVNVEVTALWVVNLPCRRCAMAFFKCLLAASHVSSSKQNTKSCRNEHLAPQSLTGHFGRRVLYSTALLVLPADIENEGAVGVGRVLRAEVLLQDANNLGDSQLLEVLSHALGTGVQRVEGVSLEAVDHVRRSVLVGRVEARVDLEHAGDVAAELDEVEKNRLGLAVEAIRGLHQRRDQVLGLGLGGETGLFAGDRKLLLLLIVGLLQAAVLAVQFFVFGLEGVELLGIHLGREADARVDLRHDLGAFLLASNGHDAVAGIVESRCVGVRDRGSRDGVAGARRAARSIEEAGGRHVEDVGLGWDKSFVMLFFLAKKPQETSDLLCRFSGRREIF